MLENANVENVILALGHEKEQVKQFLRKKRFDINIRFLDVDTDDKTQKVLEIAKKFTSQNKLIVLL
jgi:NDP-sugar pyrophosphorylase family protein